MYLNVMSVPGTPKEARSPVLMSREKKKGMVD